MLMHKGTQRLDTERLVLRKYRLSDANGIYNHYAKDERVARFLSWQPYKCVEDVRLFIEQSIEAYRSEWVYHWVIEWDKQPIGSISVISLDEKNELCEIGYCLGFDYWNQGIASESLRVVMEFLFEQVHMHRIYAKHDEDNPGSGRIMQKCGMVLEGKLRGYYKRHDGTYGDSLLYGI